MQQYRVVVLDRQKSVLVFDAGSDSPNYVASCNVFLCGDVGIMHTINGERFYDAFCRDGHLHELFEKLGVTTLQGYATPEHARLMRIMLRGQATVTIRYEGDMAGRSMVWVVVKPL